MKDAFDSKDIATLDKERRMLIDRRGEPPFNPWAHNALRDCVRAQIQLGVVKQYIKDDKKSEAIASLIPITIWLEEVNTFIQENHRCFDEKHHTLERVEVEGEEDYIF